MLVRLFIWVVVHELTQKNIYAGRRGEFMIRLKSIMKSNNVTSIQDAYNMITTMILGDTSDAFVRIVRSFKTKRQRLLALVASDEAPDKIQRYIEIYMRVRVRKMGKDECTSNNMFSSLSPEECQLLLDTLFPNDAALRQAVQNYNTLDGKRVVDTFLKERAQKLNAALALVNMSSESATTVLPARLRQEIMSGADMFARDKDTGEMDSLWGYDILNMLVEKGVLIPGDMSGVAPVTQHIIGVVLGFAVRINETLSTEAEIPRPTFLFRQMNKYLEKGKGQYFTDTTKLRRFVAFLVVYVVVEIVMVLYDCVHVGAAALAFYTENLRWLSVYANYASFQWKKNYPDDRLLMHITVVIWVIKIVTMVWLIKWYIQLIGDILPSIFIVPRVVEEDDNPDPSLTTTRPRD
jgi:hypothetical protein